MVFAFAFPNISATIVATQAAERAAVFSEQDSVIVAEVSLYIAGVVAM